MDNEPRVKSPRLQKLEAELKEWGLDLEQFANRARQVGGGSARLGELKKAGADGAKEMEKGLEAAWAELRKAFDEAAAKFKQRP
jgi:hypothetical protein